MSIKIDKFTPVIINGQVIGVVTEDTLVEGPLLPVGLFYPYFT